MQEKNKNKDDKSITNTDMERQRMIDKGGTQKYGDGHKKENKDDNVLIDAEH
jgi:hypothetical protein